MEAVYFPNKGIDIGSRVYRLIEFLLLRTPCSNYSPVLPRPDDISSPSGRVDVAFSHYLRTHEGVTVQLKVTCAG